jgi:tetratricopeptide (TPR) repeat protein
MMAPCSRIFCLLALAAAIAMPSGAYAVSGQYRKASETLLGKGLVSGDLNRARHYFELAIVADPANAAALAALGQNYWTKKQPAIARKYFNLALDVDPGEPDALYGSAELDIADGKIANARDRLRILKVVCPACRQTNDLERKLDTGNTGSSSSNP